MGRPPKQPTDRRQPTTLRLDPDARAKLERYAADSGRSLGKEIEARIAAMIELDALGVDLISRLGAAISALTKRNKGKRWHVDLTGWAAVAELLTEGPIQDLRPTAEPDADQQWEAIEPLLAIDQQREDLVAQLTTLGFSVAPEHRLQGLLRLNNRDMERAALNNAPEGELKSSAIRLHTRILELDEEYDQASQRFRAAMKPYGEAEEAGRQMCRDYLRSEAQNKRDASENYNPIHLTRTFSEWR